MIAQRAVRGTAIILASSYTNMALGIVYGIVMARLLAPAHFGLFALAMFFFGLLDVRGKLGLDYAFVHRQPTTPELLAAHWGLQAGAALMTLLIAGLVMPFAPYLGEAVQAALRLLPVPASVLTGFSVMSGEAAPLGPIVLALAGSMLIEAVGATARAALEKELVFARSTLVVTSALFFSYLAAVGLALAGFTYWALVGQVAVNALCGTIGFWWAYLHLGRPVPFPLRMDSALTRWMLRFGLTMTLGSFAAFILFQFDNFLVGAFAGTAALGYYAQAYKVAQWPTGLVTHVIARASLPTYAQLQTDTPRLSKAFEMSLWLILTAATPLALAIFASAPDFLRLLYGDVWLPAAPLLRFLIGYSVLRPLLDDTGALLTALGRPRRVTTILAAQAAALILVATPLTLVWGATGTAIAVGITFVIGIALAYYYVNQVLTLDMRWIFGPPLAAALGSLVLYFSMTRLVDLNVLPLLVRVLVKGGFVAALFLAILMLLQHRTMFDRLRYLRRLLINR
ncbi:MAG: oligosaccharide flippase family protein [Anaerolineales bacterium]|nr:oligosaccharide flippase family protein [Anaerolineales bacterium]